MTTPHRPWALEEAALLCRDQILDAATATADVRSLLSLQAAGLCSAKVRYPHYKSGRLEERESGLHSCCNRGQVWLPAKLTNQRIPNIQEAEVGDTDAE